MTGETGCGDFAWGCDGDNGACCCALLLRRLRATSPSGVSPSCAAAATGHSSDDRVHTTTPATTPRNRLPPEPVTPAKLHCMHYLAESRAPRRGKNAGQRQRLYRHYIEVWAGT